MRVKRDTSVYLDPSDDSPISVDRGKTTAWVTVKLAEYNTVTVFVDSRHLKALSVEALRIAGELDGLK